MQENEMSKLIKGALVVALLGSLPATAFAQRSNGRPQAHQSSQTRNAPVQRYREVAVSRGHRWHKGQRLAASQRRFVVNDWNQRGLRAPPRGYRWVRENNNSGDYLLIAAASGLIASILSQ
jgi:Ni/Co efflux regulator RcnB